jgi:hypothetical protein
MYEVEFGGDYAALRFSFGTQRCGGQRSFIVPGVAQERNVIVNICLVYRTL